LTGWMMRSPRHWSAPGGSSRRPRSPRTCARRTAAAGARSTLSTVTALACVPAAHIGRTSAQPSMDAIEAGRTWGREMARARCHLFRSRGLPSGHASSFPDRPVICPPTFPIPAGLALLSHPDAAPLLRGLTVGKGIPRLTAGWLLAAYVCLAAGAAWALPCVVTDIPAYDKIIQVVMLGFTMLMITAIAIALAAQGSQTRAVSSS
jgi:hypothetical protein